MSATHHIVEHVSLAPEGTNVSANELLRYGSRPAIDMALSRLAKSKALLRIERGTYVAPVQTRFGLRPPSLDAVVRDWGRRHFVAVVPSGAATANALGLTTQVPAKSVWLTTGRSATLNVGKASAMLRHAPAWLVLPGKAGQVLRALHYLGEEHAEKAWPELVSVLDEPDQSVLLRARGVVPAWLARLLASIES